MFRLAAEPSIGIDLTHVAYKGESASMTDLIGGQISSSFNSIGTAMPHLKRGRVRALAPVGAVRSKVLPEVPTFGEAGVPKLDASGWFGLLAPDAFACYIREDYLRWKALTTELSIRSE